MFFPLELGSDWTSREGLYHFSVQRVPWPFSPRLQYVEQMTGSEGPRWPVICREEREKIALTDVHSWGDNQNLGCCHLEMLDKIKYLFHDICHLGKVKNYHWPRYKDGKKWYAGEAVIPGDLADQILVLEQSKWPHLDRKSHTWTGSGHPWT